MKQLVAHRGASAYAPEHTLAAYRLAIEQGADYVEQDLAVTKDGAFICLHDEGLERTTNVKEVYPDRFSVDPATGARRWRPADFTLADIRRLDAGGWFDARVAGERVPTWQEAIDTARGRAGLYPELKSPALYRARGVDMVELLAQSLRRNGLDDPARDPTTPVILQCFEEATLRALGVALPRLPRVLLIDPASAPRRMTPTGLAAIARFATGIGPDKAVIDGRPELVRLAHDAGLTVTPYAFRSRATGRFPDVRAEMRYFLFDLDADGLFTDNPDQFPQEP